jgi:hypothetical protein
MDATGYRELEAFLAHAMDAVILVNDFDYAEAEYLDEPADLAAMAATVATGGPASRRPTTARTRWPRWPRSPAPGRCG